MADTATDRELLKAAFADLRRRGWFARMNWKDCQSCGWAAAEAALEAERGHDLSPEEISAARIVFWHDQDDDSFKPDYYGTEKDGWLHRKLCLAWSGDAEEVCSVLRDHGLTVEWDGRDGTRVAVLPCRGPMAEAEEAARNTRTGATG